MSQQKHCNQRHIKRSNFSGQKCECKHSSSHIDRNEFPDACYTRYKTAEYCSQCRSSTNDMSYFSPTICGFIGWANAKPNQTLAIRCQWLHHFANFQSSKTVKIIFGVEIRRSTCHKYSGLTTPRIIFFQVQNDIVRV